MNKIIAFIASGRKNGTSAAIVQDILDAASGPGVETKTYRLTDIRLSPCRGCFSCRTSGRCAINDDMQSVIDDVDSADAIIFSSPIYMFQVTGQAKMLLDRFYPRLKGQPGRYEPAKPVKTISVYTQGNPNTEAFAEAIALNNRALGIVGLQVVDTIVAGAANDPKNAASNEKLSSRIKSVGEKLLK